MYSKISFDLPKRLKYRFMNLPIYRKLLLLVGILTLTLLTAALTAVQLTFLSDQKLLYSSVSSLMNNSAAEISGQISDSVELTQSMLSNPALQAALCQLKDSPPSAPALSPYTNLYQELSTLIYDYYYSYPSKNIAYIALTNGSFTLSTYNKGNRLLAPILESIIERAEAASGNPVLITDYAQEYGVFLARTVRRIDSLRLDSLGTILVNIDIASLVDDATQTISLTEDVSYVLSDCGENAPFFSSASLEVPAYPLSGEYSYGVCRIGSHKYFAVRGEIRDFCWDYLCLIRYDDILSSLSRTKLLCIALILLSALILFSFSQKMVRSLTRHLHSLAEKMVAFGRDDSVVPASAYDYTKRLDEIGTLHNQFDAMAHKIQILINENYRNELLKKDMLLKNLQNQINPHFLYNTLESINWRAKASGEEEISRMTEALGSLLRTSLTPASSRSTLGAEMEIVHNYLTIQELRFEDRLRYTEQIPQELLTAEVPLLCIQPLIENAVRYGLEPNIGGCAISVTARVSDERLIIQILNDGSQFESCIPERLSSHETAPHGFGIGILNI